MSLLRLLSTGKSLVGLREAKPYQVPEEPMLPRFERKENPFRATTLPVHPKGPISIDPAHTQPVIQAPAVEAVPTPTPAQEPAQCPKPVARPEAVASRPRRGVLGALKAWGKRLTRRGGVPEVRRAPAQTELRLETIKVLRNDLSETDIEVVPRADPKAEPVKPASARGPAASPAAVADSAWGRVSARVFGPHNLS